MEDAVPFDDGVSDRDDIKILCEKVTLLRKLAEEWFQAFKSSEIVDGERATDLWRDYLAVCAEVGKIVSANEAMSEQEFLRKLPANLKDIFFQIEQYPANAQQKFLILDNYRTLFQRDDLSPAELNEAIDNGFRIPPRRQAP